MPAFLWFLLVCSIGCAASACASRRSDPPGPQQPAEALGQQSDGARKQEQGDAAGQREGSVGKVDEPPAAAVVPPYVADVIRVQVQGSADAYTFSVRVRSPDTGCERYADYWEVLSPEGQLLYRRILAHSHVDEQPFTRSGGPVPIGAAQEVLVRAHMNPDGYGGAAMRGSPQAGFEPFTVAPDFAAAVAQQPPRVGSCAF